MPLYSSLKRTPAGRRTAARLLSLRGALDAAVPARTIADNFLLATWNICELDSPRYGARGDECLFYIAEILARFDLIAIQEVHEDLTALRRVVDILGEWWKFICTDVSEGRRGNRERMAFLYDSRKVRFTGTVGEVFIANGNAGSAARATATYRVGDQLARTPFLCGFEVGFFKFHLCAVHIFHGDGRADRKRLKEIRLLAKALAKRARDAQVALENVILLGDFNIFDPRDITFSALTDEGFTIPRELQELPSNAARNRHYDQIAFIEKDSQLVMTGRAGVFDFFDTVYRDEDEALYARDMGNGYARAKNRTSYYRSDWRSHQMSDHLPMWVELKVDFSDRILSDIARPKKR